MSYLNSIWRMFGEVAGRLSLTVDIKVAGVGIKPYSRNLAIGRLRMPASTFVTLRSACAGRDPATVLIKHDLTVTAWCIEVSICTLSSQRLSVRSDDVGTAVLSSCE